MSSSSSSASALKPAFYFTKELLSCGNKKAGKYVKLCCCDGIPAPLLLKVCKNMYLLGHLFASVLLLSSGGFKNKC